MISKVILLTKNILYHFQYINKHTSFFQSLHLSKHQYRSLYYANKKSKISVDELLQHL